MTLTAGSTAVIDRGLPALRGVWTTTIAIDEPKPYHRAVVAVPLPPEVDRLTKFEKKYAVPVYSKWMAIYTSERPNQEEDNKRRALNGAYFTAGRFWLMPTVWFGIPGSFIFSASQSLLGVVLLVAAGVFMCVALWRAVQALRFYPHLSMRRVRLSAKHPDPWR